VRGLALFGTNLYAAGYFQSIGGLSRTGLAKINIAGTGAGDPAWTLNAGGLGGGVCEAMALSGTNLYVGGGFQTIGSSVKTNLARIFLSASGTGMVDNVWIPNPFLSSDPLFSEVTAITVSETNVFVGGRFDQIGGQTRANLARVSTTGSGAANASRNYKILTHSGRVTDPFSRFVTDCRQPKLRGGGGDAGLDKPYG